MIIRYFAIVMKKHFVFAVAICTALALAACSNEISEKDCGAYRLVEQSRGATLGYSPASGLEILYEDGFAFKDLNRNGALDSYEDWRLSAAERAADLASQLPIERICGLMLYSSAVQSVFAPENSNRFF